MSVTGVIDQEPCGRGSPDSRGVTCRASAGSGSPRSSPSIPYAVSRATEPLGLATTVGLAFAVAAATFAPLIMLGVWWRRLSTWGAMAGLVAGGLSALLAIGTTMATGPAGGWTGRCWPTPPCGRPAIRRHRGHRLARDAVPDPGRHHPHDGAPAHPRARGPGPLPLRD